jgi:DNA-binding NarL/FixJ family response regulator
MTTIAVPDRSLCVMVVDDHEVVHWGLRTILERLSWVARTLSAHDGREATELAARYEVDVALVDLFVGSDSGPEICERLRATRPSLRVLLISGAGHISARAGASCGASGFVSKDLRGAEIIRAVRTVALGGEVFVAEPEPEALPVWRLLSRRERQVLELIASGATNREIGEQLYLSRHTVKDYTSALYRKLQVRNRVEAAKRADELGLVSPPGGVQLVAS